MKLHEVSIKLTKGQIVKILHDQPLDVKHSHIGHGRHILYLKKKYMDKLMNEEKIHLDADEKNHTIEGNGLGHFINSIKRGAKKAFKPKNIESALIHQGIPFATGAIGSALGGPAGGFAGSIAGHEIANIVGEETGRGMKIVSRSYKGTPATKNPIKKGQGLFKALHKIGISRKDVKHAAKKVGKAAVEHGIDAIGTAAAAYGFPVPPAITESLKQGADHIIDGNNRRAYESIKAPVKEIMKEQVQKQVDKLPIEVQPYVQSKVVSMGFGLKNKHQRIVKGGTLRITRMSKKLYKNDFPGVVTRIFR